MKKLILVLLCLMLVAPGMAAFTYTDFTAYGDAWKSTNDTYTVIKWNTTGTHQWLATGNSSSVSVLVLGGGGSGGTGGSNTAGAGGGGAGGLVLNSSFPVSGDVALYVGAGGTAPAAYKNGTSGWNSSFSSLIGWGGGGGGAGGTAGQAATSGGSGGGGGNCGGGGSCTPGSSLQSLLTSSILGYGYAGTQGGTSTGQYVGGGGGGASGTTTYSTTTNTGGPGKSSDITGTAITYGYGGSGGYWGSGSFYCGGADGYSTNSGHISGSSGLGGGGAGCYSSETAGNGGSGVVIIQYRTLAAPSAVINDVINPSTVGNTTQFNDGSANSPTSWDWGWGDGTANSTLQNPTHTFTSVGTYQVFLNVSNEIGYNSTVVTHTVRDPVGYNRQDLEMDQRYILRIEFLDSDTNMPIPVVRVGDSLGGNQNTSAGIFSSTFSYGTVLVYVYADGYISAAQTYIMDSDRSEVMKLQKVATTPTVPPSVRYTPHLVRFIAKDYAGQPVQGVTVFAQGYETTTSDNWIYAVLGLDMNIVPMTNTTLRGTTGSDGSIVFLMLESVQYSVNFTSQAQGVSQSLTIFPKEDSYLVMLGTTGAGSYDSNFGKGSANITRTLWANQSGTRVTFNFTYRDPTSSTTSVFFYVEDESHKPIYNSTYVGSVRNFSYVLDPLDHGKTYYYGYLAQSSTFGRMYENRLITTHSRLLAPLEYLGWDTSWYMWITVVCLIFFVALFSGTTSIYGTLLFPFWSLFFGYIGWLDWCPFEFLVAVAVLGTAAFISKMYSRVGDG